MRLISRAIGGLVLGLGLLAFAGCGEDNASTAAATQKSDGTAQAAPPPNAPPPAKNQDDYAKQYQAQQKNMYKGAGYPGAK